MGMSGNFGLLSGQTSMLESTQDRSIRGLSSPGTSRGTTDDAKIAKGAQDFEAVLVGTWLQQAEQSFATVPGADDDGDKGQRDQVMSFGVQALATSLAASGGIGIGKMVAKAMHVAAAKEDGAGSGPHLRIGTTFPQPAEAKIR